MRCNLVDIHGDNGPRTIKTSHSDVLRKRSKTPSRNNYMQDHLDRAMKSGPVKVYSQEEIAQFSSSNRR